MVWLRPITVSLWTLVCCLAATAVANPSAQQIARSLRQRLSSGSEVYVLSQGNYTAEITQRWNAFEPPTYVIAVKPRLETDVREVASSAPQMRCQLDNGIDIDLGFFNSVNVDAANNLMTIGGSVRFSQVFDPLYNVGKEIATGSCSCVGMVGATLGGGIGPLQGVRGLIIDALVSVRIVTGTGEIVTASKTQNSDLFWGIRGAGANFGIVTSATYRVSDQTNGGNVVIMDVSFAAEKNASVFNLLDSLVRNGQPGEFSIGFGAVWDPNAGAPVISLSSFYFGPESAAAAYNQPFLDLGPTVQRVQTVPWNKLISTMRFGGDTQACIKGRLQSVYGSNLYSFDPANFQRTFADMSDFFAANPNLRNSMFVAELFPPANTVTVPDGETAYPFRNTTAYSLFQFALPDPSYQPTVDAFAVPARRAYAAGGGNPNVEVYVNYAHGDEGVNAWYSPRKLGRLRGLKNRWDPHNLFSFTNGINPPRRN
uniref:FAD-linked oxidoreductase n=1 Tax=Ovatospora brasiliensis TaxID=1934393 RepID=A0A8K0ZG47_9PEZI|nr:FAD-linked oxidoreductase [Ovatospora brasiliensis]